MHKANRKDLGWRRAGSKALTQHGAWENFLGRSHCGQAKVTLSNFNAVQISKFLKKNWESFASVLSLVWWLGNSALWGGMGCLNDRKRIQTVTENMECLGHWQGSVLLEYQLRKEQWGKGPKKKERVLSGLSAASGHLCPMPRSSLIWGLGKSWVHLLWCRYQKINNLLMVTYSALTVVL